MDEMIGKRHQILPLSPVFIQPHGSLKDGRDWPEVRTYAKAYDMGEKGSKCLVHHWIL